VVLAIVLSAVVPAVAGARGLARARPPAASGQEAVPDQVIVQFRAGVSASARSRARQTADVGVVKAMRHPGQQLLRVESGQTVPAAIRALDRDPRVAYAQRNYVYRAAAVPNDPQFGQLWGMRNIG